MDAQIKTKWLKALRSGRYKQGKGNLLDEAGNYCCLGVLAKIQRAKKEDILYNGYLEGDLAKYNAGLRVFSQHLLARMNDGKDNGSPKKSFKEIADYIEKKYK